MSSFDTEARASFLINIGEFNQPDLDAHCKRFNIRLADLPPLKFEGPVLIDMETVNEDAIVAAYESNRIAGDWLQRVYRALAEYDCETAMDELYRQFGSYRLRLPYHERAIVDLLQGYRGTPSC